MSETRIYCDAIGVELRVGPDMTDITAQLRQLVRRSGISDGHLSATVVGSTGSLTTIEYEPGVIEDLKRAVNRMAPPGLEYEHEKAWHDGNGHSHVQAALVGPSLDLPIRGGELRGTRMKTRRLRQPLPGEAAIDPGEVLVGGGALPLRYSVPE